MEALNRTIGDIKPENIVVNEDGYVKLISHFSWPGQPVKAAAWEKGQDRLFLGSSILMQRLRSARNGRRDATSSPRTCTSTSRRSSASA